MAPEVLVASVSEVTEVTEVSEATEVTEATGVAEMTDVSEVPDWSRAAESFRDARGPGDIESARDDAALGYDVPVIPPSTRSSIPLT